MFLARPSSSTPQDTVSRDRCARRRPSRRRRGHQPPPRRSRRPPRLRHRCTRRRRRRRIRDGRAQGPDDRARTHARRGRWPHRACRCRAGGPRSPAARHPYTEKSCLQINTARRRGGDRTNRPTGAISRTQRPTRVIKPADWCDQDASKPSIRNDGLAKRPRSAIFNMHWSAVRVAHPNWTVNSSKPGIQGRVEAIDQGGEDSGPVRTEPRRDRGPLQDQAIFVGGDVPERSPMVRSVVATP
jgi:hypothetical protein